MVVQPLDLAVAQNATGTSGTGTPVRHFYDKWVQVIGLAGGCELSIEGTIDGTNWSKSSANSGGIPGVINADGTYEVPEAWEKVRVNRTVQGTGNPTVKLAFRGIVQAESPALP